MATGWDNYADKMRMRKNVVCAVGVLVTHTVLQPSCCQIPPLPDITDGESRTPRLSISSVSRDLERRPGLQPPPPAPVPRQKVYLRTDWKPHLWYLPAPDIIGDTTVAHTLPHALVWHPTSADGRSATREQVKGTDATTDHAQDQRETCMR